MKFNHYLVGDLKFTDFCAAYTEAKITAWLSGIPCPVLRVETHTAVTHGKTQILERTRICATAPHQVNFYADRSRFSAPVRN